VVVEEQEASSSSSTIESRGKEHVSINCFRKASTDEVVCLTVTGAYDATKTIGEHNRFMKNYTKSGALQTTSVGKHCYFTCQMSLQIELYFNKYE
jgi:hypothetical protein